MYVLSRFGLKEMTDLNSVLRGLGEDAASMEEVANRIVDRLYDGLLLEDGGERACVMARAFISAPYAHLDPELKQLANAILRSRGEGAPASDIPCFTLLASRGLNPQWNSRHDSVSHKVFPYTCPEALDDVPMLKQSLTHLGLGIDFHLEPDPEIVLDLSRKTFNIFCAEKAVGCPWIPHQDDFVIPFGVESYLILGVVLSSGWYFCINLFLKQAISHECAQFFKPLALGIKLALSEFDCGPVFPGVYLEGTDASTPRLSEEKLALEQYRIHTLNELLEVHEQVVQVKTELLERAIKQLDQSNADLQQFAYIASHDLQEPLRAVLGYLELLSRRNQDKLDAESQSFLNQAVGGAKRMHVLIRDLLEYARIGAQDKMFLLTDCDDCLDAALANLQMAIEESSAVVDRDKLPAILGSSTQLIQLFQNLVGNALKFRREGVRPVLEVRAKQNGQNWLLTIRDNGIGFDASNADKVFTIFKRLHSRKAYPGTGIGLAVCKKIVENHGGMIWAESTPGAGSTFSFTFPTVPETVPTGLE